MRHIHTHYDNLKVSRDAHPKVIRAAYKKLSRQYHPDHNPNDPEATKIMQVINLAYDVLSDPVKRREHDEWISRVEAENEIASHFAGRANFSHPTSENTGNQWESVQPAPSFMNGRTSSRHKREPASGINKKAIADHVFKHWLWYVLAIAIITGFGYHSYSRNSYTPFSLTYQTLQKPANSNPSLSRTTAENGKHVRQDQASNQEAAKHIVPEPVLRNQHYSRPESWPEAASYLPDYEQLNLNGLSSATIDNSDNDSPVMVKLYYLNSEKPYPVRTFYIPAHGAFKVDRIAAGKYDIRYRYLRSGILSRSEPFELLETSFKNGARFSSVNLSLSMLHNDDKQTTWLAEEDF